MIEVQRGTLGQQTKRLTELSGEKSHLTTQIQQLETLLRGVKTDQAQLKALAIELVDELDVEHDKLILGLSTSCWTVINALKAKLDALP